MKSTASALSASIGDFFLRCGLLCRTQHDCNAYIQSLYPTEVVQPAACQGWCSYTLAVGDQLIVQFRPTAYQLDMDVAQAAKKLYGSSAPATTLLSDHPDSGLKVYVMERMQGVSYKTFRDSPFSQQLDCRRRLCEDFAIFLARAWTMPPDVNLPRRKIGSSLRPRLERLSKELPLRFRPTAKYVLDNLEIACHLPWVLTHGDIVASNIMTDPVTGHLYGLVDWAEAEILPFGTSLYGLEELLGSMASSGFVYDSFAEELRVAFFQKLYAGIPDLRDDDMLKSLAIARDMGVLLWHGFAFDDGAIDRVVEVGIDDAEIAYLDAFLNLGIEIECGQNRPTGFRLRRDSKLDSVDLC